MLPGRQEVLHEFAMTKCHNGKLQKVNLTLHVSNSPCQANFAGTCPSTKQTWFQNALSWRLLLMTRRNLAVNVQGKPDVYLPKSLCSSARRQGPFQQTRQVSSLGWRTGLHIFTATHLCFINKEQLRWITQSTPKNRRERQRISPWVQFCVTASMRVSPKPEALRQYVRRTWCCFQELPALGKKMNAVIARAQIPPLTKSLWCRIHKQKSRNPRLISFHSRRFPTNDICCKALTRHGLQDADLMSLR